MSKKADMAGNNIYVQGSYIDIHDNEVVNLSVDKGEVHLDDNQHPEKEVGRGKIKELPAQLQTAKAEELMENLVDEGILTEDWQPNGLSGSERGLVARAVCDSLKIEDVWQVFGLLWNEKPETLRSYFNKALEQRKSLLFQEKLKNIIS